MLWLNTGHLCLSIERVYADKAIHDEFVGILTEKAKAITINHPTIGEGHLGPIIHAPQADIIQDHLDDAVAKGATITTGGLERHDGGVWCTPVVMTDVNHKMDIMVEETFGPIVPVMAYDSIEQAIELANDTDFGLSGAVLGPNADAAMEVGQQLEAGAISINDTALTSQTFEAEKNAFKLSGMGGSRMGMAGIKRFFRKQAMIVQADRPVGMDAFSEEAMS